MWLGHGIWDPLPSFARIAGAVGLAKEGCYTWIACEGKYEFEEKKKKKESKETIPVNIYWRFLNRTWLVLMCWCFYLLWGDKIKEWSILMKRYLLPPFINQSQRWNVKIILPKNLFKLSTSWIYSLAWIQDSSMVIWLRIWQHAWFLTCGESYWPISKR